MMLRDTMKSWSDSQSDLYSSDQEEEEQMIFGENEDDLEEMMDLSDLPTSLFACSVHEAVFEVQEEKVRWREVYLGHSIVSIDTAIEQLCLNFQCVTAYYNWRGKKQPKEFAWWAQIRMSTVTKEQIILHFSGIWHC